MKNKFISYIMIIFGGILTAAAFGLFVLPQGFVAGGVTGLSVILSGFMNLPDSFCTGMDLCRKRVHFQDSDHDLSVPDSS